MDFELDDTQTMLKDGVARFVEREYGFDQRQAVVAGGGLSGRNWATFAELGWLGAPIPEEYGGFGGGPEEAMVILEQFGRALVVEPYLAMAVLAPQTLIGSGDPRTAELIGQIALGEQKLVLAHSEPAARGVLSHVSTTAVAHGDTWRLRGLKSLVLGAPFADKLIVSARIAGEVAAPEGVALFLVDRALPGVEARDFRLSDGSAASEIIFDDAVIDVDAMLAGASTGLSAIRRGHAFAIAGLCAEAVGAMDAAIWITRDYLKTRTQFGQPIGNFQALQHRMAEMLVEMELSRSAVFRAVAMLDADDHLRDRAAASAKVQIGKSAKFVGGQAIQLHGGIGVTEEYVIGHYFKRLTLLDNLFGPSETHLSYLAGER